MAGQRGTYEAILNQQDVEDTQSGVLKPTTYPNGGTEAKDDSPQLTQQEGNVPAVTVPKGQAEQVMKNLQAVLTAAGYTFDEVVKTTCFLADMNDFAKVNEIYKSYFGTEFPARSCVQVAKLPLGGLVEVECIAYV